jgi:serine/threonine-protein kinase
MLILGVVIGVGVLFAWRGKQGHIAGETTRLAVLPFENLGDSADAYFADGVTDEVRGKLSNLGTLLVTPRQSSMPYRGSARALREIGDELGVQYLLTATVRWEKSGGSNRVRVTPELVDVSTGATRWQQPFDATLTDVFKVQGDIAVEVAQALNVALGDSVREQLAEKPTQNLAAWDAYLRGEEVSGSLNRNDPASLRKAITYYEQATVLDSGFVQAWARLSNAHALLFGNNPTRNSADAARHGAERAIALAPNSPAAHSAMGQYYRFVEADHARARAEFNTVLRLAPRDVDALVSAGIMDRIGLDWSAAEDKFKRALDLDRRSLRAYIHLSQVLLNTRKYAELDQVLKRGRSLFPTNLPLLQRAVTAKLAEGDSAAAKQIIRSAPRDIDPATLVTYLATGLDLYWILDDPEQQLLLRLRPADFDDNRGTWASVLAQVYRLRGDSLRARAFADTMQAELIPMMRQSPSDEQWVAFRGLALAYLGRKDEAIELGRRATAMNPLGENDASLYSQLQVVRIYVAVGETEKALDLLEQLLKTPFYISPGWLRVDPNFAPLKGNPRFEAMLR